MPRQPSAIDVLQQQRSGQPMSEPGLQQPGIDPIMVIASLLGPGILRGLLGPPGASGGALAGGSGMAAQGAQGSEQGFSQADMMLSRLKAGQGQLQSQGVTPESMMQPLRQMYPDIAKGINPMRGGRGVDQAMSGYPVPSMSSSAEWTLGPDQEVHALFQNPKTQEQFWSQGPSLQGLVASAKENWPDEILNVLRSSSGPAVHDSTRFLRALRAMNIAGRN